ncbi:hypothetical protein SH584_02040 [Sphingomonas sp. LY29]|uniref:hypothetical protein n=1 Tax=Sphingomonas sp. LY29 TaxID=3095341 RepID=UPI002D774CEE|nr:hypothetical protein [Sphingomonas sp. LY29]WRP26241.1 hypothetical protein SH584_02040 [Sphingomonas sp. LY29]
MLEALVLRASNAVVSRQVDLADFACLLVPVLREDRSDAGVMPAHCGQSLFVSDARIDNRAEIIARLGLPKLSVDQIGDASLLLHAWRRWRVDLFDHVIGDIALAVREGEERKLTLARSPMSLRSLFYAEMPHGIAFASQPASLRVIDGIGATPNLENLAAATSGEVFSDGSLTLYQGIDAVRQGTAVEFSAFGTSTRQLWFPADVPIIRESLADTGASLREELDRSVRARLRRNAGSVASHFSAGRYSSAVATSAAIVLGEGGERLHAMTSAPDAGFDDGARDRWIADESVLAGVTARTYPTIHHEIVRAGSRNFLSALEEHNRCHFWPQFNLPTLDGGTRS